MALNKHQFQIGSDKQPEAPLIEMVPDPIIEDILWRGPAKTILRCKTLNKSWLQALDAPTFSRNHFSRASVCPLFVFGEKSRQGSSRIIYPIEVQNVPDLDHKINKSQVISRNFSVPKTGPSGIRSRFLRCNYSAVSCEGLVCWASYTNSGEDYVIICNPVTGEYASVSASPMHRGIDYIFIGMGFCCSTKKFELLRVCGSTVEFSDEVSHWWPEVRTVGDGQWRRVGDSVYTSNLVMFFNGISQVVYVNGVIYWHFEGNSELDSDLCCFDFNRGVFEVIPLPQSSALTTEGLYHFQNMKLGVLGNSLCVSVIFLNDGPVELWILKDDGVWSKLYHLEIGTGILEEDCIPQFKAIKYLDGGEILMHRWEGKLVIYDPTKKEMRQVCVLEDSCLEDLSKDGIDCKEVIPHVPCLVKLKEVLNVDEVGLEMMEEDARGKMWLVK